MECYCSGTERLWCGDWNHLVCRRSKCEVDHPSQSTVVNPGKKQKWCSLLCPWSQVQQDTSGQDNFRILGCLWTIHHRCTCKWDWTEMLNVSFPLRAKTVWNPLRMNTAIVRGLSQISFFISLLNYEGFLWAFAMVVVCQQGTLNLMHTLISPCFGLAHALNVETIFPKIAVIFLTIDFTYCNFIKLLWYNMSQSVYSMKVCVSMASNKIYRNYIKHPSTKLTVRIKLLYGDKVIRRRWFISKYDTGKYEDFGNSFLILRDLLLHYWRFSYTKIVGNTAMQCMT